MGILVLGYEWCCVGLMTKGVSCCVGKVFPGERLARFLVSRRLARKSAPAQRMLAVIL